MWPTFILLIIMLPCVAVGAYNMGRDAGIKDGKLEALLYSVGKMQGDGR